MQRSGHSGKEGAEWSGSQGRKAPGRLHLQSLAWDVTDCTTVADSYWAAAQHAAGAVAEQADADRKCQKYAELSAAYEFQRVAVETHGPLSVSTVSFLVDLGRTIFLNVLANRLKYSFYSSGSVS